MNNPSLAKTRLLSGLMLLLLLGLTACRQPSQAAPAPVQTFPTPTVAVADPAPPPTSPVATPASPLPTPATISETALIEVHAPAMRPAHTEDIGAVASRGATRYHLAVTASITNAGATLSGTVQAEYTNTEAVPLAEIYFRLYPNLPGYGGVMTVDTVTVDGQPVAAVGELDNTVLRVPLAAPLEPGEMATLHLSYQVQVPTGVQRGYNIFSYTDQTVALAGFVPLIAVYDDNGWDTVTPPSYGDATYLDIALFTAALTVPADMVVAASGTQVDAIDNEDGTKTLVVVSGPMRDFYVAMRPDFEILSETIDGITVNSYYPPRLGEGGQLALQYAVDSLRVFNASFGPYPYSELDVVATPTTAGGVEYPGVIVIAQGLYDSPGGFFQHATSHEVAHQWWYGVVGNDQIDEPWLDESLTNYSTVFYWEQAEGPEVAQQIIEGFFLRPYRQAQNQERAVTDPVAAYSQGEYATFVYGKGPLFFHALRRELGEAMYLEIMQTYYTRYQYELADAEALFSVIREVSGRNIEPLIVTWLEGPQ